MKNKLIYAARDVQCVSEVVRCLSEVVRCLSEVMLLYLAPLKQDIMTFVASRGNIGIAKYKMQLTNLGDLFMLQFELKTENSGLGRATTEIKLIESRLDNNPQFIMSLE